MPAMGEIGDVAPNQLQLDSLIKHISDVFPF